MCFKFIKCYLILKTYFHAISALFKKLKLITKTLEFRGGGVYHILCSQESVQFPNKKEIKITAHLLLHILVPSKNIILINLHLLVFFEKLTLL